MNRSFPTSASPEGRVFSVVPTYTFRSAVQPLNTPSSRSSSFEPASNFTLESAVSFEKAVLPIDSTDFGIMMFVNFTAFEKALFPMVFSDDESFALASVLQLLKALSPISTIFCRFTVLLLVLPTKLVQPLKTFLPIYCLRNEGSSLASIPSPAVSLILRTDIPVITPSFPTATAIWISPP